MTFTSVKLPATEVRFVLSGPAGRYIDLLVASLIGAGVTIEPIKAGERYRLRDTTRLLESLADALGPIEGIDLVREEAPVDKIVLTSCVAPRIHRRSFTVHGVGPAYSMISRAVDRWLTVTSSGMNRWSTVGR